jgi:hypothetical protein
MSDRFWERIIMAQVGAFYVQFMMFALSGGVQMVDGIELYLYSFVVLGLLFMLADWSTWL